LIEQIKIQTRFITSSRACAVHSRHQRSKWLELEMCRNALLGTFNVLWRKQARPGRPTCRNFQKAKCRL